MFVRSSQRTFVLGYFPFVHALVITELLQHNMYMCNIPKLTGSESEKSLQEVQTEESHEQNTQTPGDNLIVIHVCIVMFSYNTVC